MRNTGDMYESTERTPATAPAFANLLPRLTDEQYAALEADILQNGCYSPVIVNEDDIVIDGHHRHEICEKHGLPYSVAVFAFEDDLEAKQWALDTQKARRSLTVWELGQIALKLKTEIEARAAASHAANGGDRKSAEAISALATLPKPISEGIDTRKELAVTAGVGERTMGKIMQLDEAAPEYIKEALEDGDISVNAGYNITRLLEKLPEEARQAAAERAVELAKEKKSYKAAFDLSLDDMNALVDGDAQAAGDIRQALNEGELSVNGGKELAKIMLDMPKDEREILAEDPENIAEIEADYVRGLERADKNGDIARAYNAALEKVIPVHATDYEVRTWVEYAGYRRPEFPDLIEEVGRAVERFTKILEILQNIYETEVEPFEHLYKDDGESRPQDESRLQDESRPQGEGAE